MTKFNKTIELKNNIKHEVKLGDVFEFDFKSLETTDKPFYNSNFGTFIKEVKPERIIISASLGEMGENAYTITMLDEQDQEIKKLNLNDPLFFSYVTTKKNMVFLKNEQLDYKKPPFSIEFGDVFIVPFEKFAENGSYKQEYIDKIKNKDPQFVVIHLYNLKDTVEHLMDSFGATVYALNENGLINALSEEEEKTRAEKFEQTKHPAYEPVNYIDKLDVHRTGKLNDYYNKNLLENKSSNVKKLELNFEELSKLVGYKAKKEISAKPRSPKF